MKSRCCDPALLLSQSVGWFSCLAYDFGVQVANAAIAHVASTDFDATNGAYGIASNIDKHNASNTNKDSILSRSDQNDNIVNDNLKSKLKYSKIWLNLAEIKLKN